MRLVLRQDKNLADAGVDAVRQREIDYAELAGKRSRRLGPLVRKVAEPGAASARHDHSHGTARQAADKSAGSSRLHELLLLPLLRFLPPVFESVSKQYATFPG
jgi:hypothetical protein